MIETNAFNLVKKLLNDLMIKYPDFKDPNDSQKALFEETREMAESVWNHDANTINDNLTRIAAMAIRALIQFN